MRKFILVMVAIAAAVHCSAGDTGDVNTRADQFCEARCKCESCASADRDTCTKEMGNLASEANAGNCEDQLDGYFDCLEKDAFCDAGSYDTSTCLTEEKVLSNCINGSTGSGGASSSSGTGGSGPCAYTNNGMCDEPEGTGLCPEGTDVTDCAPPCPYTNNGMCDEPEGTALCAEGTDVADCGGTCITCSAAVGGTAMGSLCPASQTIYTALSQCACTSTTCQVSCPNFCVGLADTSTCFSCMQTYCSSQFSACSADF